MEVPKNVMPGDGRVLRRRELHDAKQCSLCSLQRRASRCCRCHGPGNQSGASSWTISLCLSSVVTVYTRGSKVGVVKCFSLSRQLFPKTEKARLILMRVQKCHTTAIRVTCRSIPTGVFRTPMKALLNPMRSVSSINYFQIPKKITRVLMRVQKCQTTTSRVT